MKMITRCFSFAIAVAIILPAGLAKSATIYWDFATANPTTPASSPDYTGGTFSQLNNNGTTTLLTTTSPSSGYTGASGGNNAGAAVKAGALDTANSTAFQWTITPAAGDSLNFSTISFGSRSTGTGPQLLTLLSSLDNYTTPLATYNVSNNSTYALQTNANFTAIATDPTPITFRLYGSGVVGTPSANTATWRIDDVTLTYTVTPVPEPSALLLGGLALIGLVGTARRLK